MFNPLWTCGGAGAADTADEPRRPVANAFVHSGPLRPERRFLVAEIPVLSVKAEAELPVKTVADDELAITQAPVADTGGVVVEGVYSKKSEPDATGGTVEMGAAVSVVPVAEEIALAEHERLLKVEWQAGFEAGRAQALATASAANDALLAQERKKIGDMLRSLDASLAEPQRLFEPLQRLAVHLAREIVRGELTQSAEVIRRLIDYCASTVERSKVLSVRLNPADLCLFQDGGSEIADRLTLIEDPTLSSGSLRLELVDGWVEDLIEHRIEMLRSGLHGGPVAAQRN